MKKQKINWGIVGLGKIAHHFVKDLLLVDDAHLTAVASRNKEKAIEFANQYHHPTAYGSYQDLFDDPDVDIVYIATPHDSHTHWAIEAMKKGKPVLCEKPMAVNRKDVEKMVAVAKQQQVFLMEAFWSRFNPTIQKVLSLVKNGAIGQVNEVQSNFSFYRAVDPTSRLFSMDLAGGSLLDVGVYPIFLAYSVFGMPDKIQATAIKADTGTDVQLAIHFTYKTGLAQLSCGFHTHSDMSSTIYGTDGRLVLHPRWHEATSYSLIKGGHPPLSENKVNIPKLGKGYVHEILECHKCIQNEQIESIHWTHQNSLDILQITDAIRSIIDLKYPFER